MTPTPPPALDLPASPKSLWWVDLPGFDQTQEPPDVRRDGLWIIEDEDVVWDAPLAGVLQ